MNDKPVGAEKAVCLPVLEAGVDRQIAEQIGAAVKQAKSALITGHERPDGDCIGSEIALCAMLRQQGLESCIVNADAAERYRFLEPADWIHTVRPDEKFSADLVFILDATDLTRLGRVKPEQLGPASHFINVDHHLGNTNFGRVNWVDPKAAATGELLWRLAAYCGWPVPLAGLRALYTALVTDTGQFSYATTSPVVLRMAAYLIENGVNPEQVWRQVYSSRTRTELALEARARASLACTPDGKICSIGLTARDFAETGGTPMDCEQFPNIPRSLAGVELALFFYELNGGTSTKASIRSTPRLDARALAQKFSGGGHRQAAGCTLPLPLAEAWKLVLEQAAELVKREG